jgi:hypothetical protein
MHKRDSAPQAICFVLGSASILPVTRLIAGDAEYCAETAKCVGTAYALPLLPFPPPGRLRLLKADSFFDPQARADRAESGRNYLRQYPRTLPSSPRECPLAPIQGRSCGPAAARKKMRPGSLPSSSTLSDRSSDAPEALQNFHSARAERPRWRSQLYGERQHGRRLRARGLSGAIPQSGLLTFRVNHQGPSTRRTSARAPPISPWK